MMAKNELKVKTKTQKGIFLIDPQGTFKKVWDSGIIVILIYTATYAPFKTAYLDDDNDGVLESSIETVVDIMFGADIFLTFLTPYMRYNETYETRHKYIALNYLAGAFWIDVIASFPTQFVMRGGGGGSDS